MKNLHDLCIKVFESEKMYYQEHNGKFYLPFESNDGIRVSIIVEPYKTRQIIIETWWRDYIIPSDKLNIVLEFMGKVNDAKIFPHLRLDFDDMTLGIITSNLFGKKLDYDTVDEILLTYVSKTVRLFDSCSPSFLEILENDIDAETAFQKFRKLDGKH